MLGAQRAGALLGTGTVSRQAALDLGLVGLAARASGVRRDARCDLPPAAYREPPGRSADRGQRRLLGPAALRMREIDESLRWLRRVLGDGGRSGATPALHAGRAGPRHAVHQRAGRLPRPGGAGAGDRRRRPGCCTTRCRTRRCSTGSAWRCRCATTRFPTSRSATRASICPTAATTCRRHAPAEVHRRRVSQGTQTIPTRARRARPAFAASP
jgi:hypothetical protein